MDSLVNILGGVRFDEPWWLLLLPLVVAGAAGYRLFRGNRRAGMLFPSVAALRSAGLAAGAAARLPEWLRWAAFALAVVALAGPRAPFPASSRDTTGIDIMIALDVSESMRQKDFGGKSRFSAARDAALRFIGNRPADRIGLVVFSGGSFTRCPLTLDHEVLARLAETVEPGFFEEPGTAIGTAVLTATNRLRASASREKVLVLITDGENNAGEVAPATAARLAARYGVRIYTIYAGKQGDGEESASSKVLSRQGREALAGLARVSGGRMFSAAESFALMKTFREIDRLEKSRLKGLLPGRNMALYPWFLLTAVALLFVEQALSATRFIRIP